MYALVGEVTQDLLTYYGRPLVHDDRAELEWLLPSARVVRVTEADLALRSPLPPLPIRDHPSLSMLRWPLTRDQFQ